MALSQFSTLRAASSESRFQYRSDLNYASVSPIRRVDTSHEILPGAEPVEVHLLDLAGRRIETLNPGYVAEGIHCFQWDPAVPCGVYFVEARAGDGILGPGKGDPALDNSIPILL